MGFSISWIAFEGMKKAGALAHAGFRDLGTEDEFYETPFSAGQMTTGWTVLVSDDVDFGSPERAAEFSAAGLVVCAQIEEHVMFSAVHAAKSGAPLFSVSHDGQKGGYDLTTSGQIPPELEAIRTRLRGEQDAAGGSGAGVDYGFDVPVELARVLAGFRHDAAQGEVAAPFTEVEPFDLPE